MKMQSLQPVEFLQWALPRLGLRWSGFKKVRRQVTKRIARRIETLQLPDFGAYRRHLETHPQEWPLLDGFCRITISRFYRDRHLFGLLAREGLPESAGLFRSRSERRLLCWSAGCGAGEEAYTLVLIGALQLSQQPGSKRLLCPEQSQGASPVLARHRLFRGGRALLHQAGLSPEGEMECAGFTRCSAGRSL